MKKKSLFIILLLSGELLKAQHLKDFTFDHQKPTTIKELKLENAVIPVSLPLFSIEVNKLKVNSNDGFFNLLSEYSLHMSEERDEKFTDGYKILLILTNNGRSAVTISNIFPFSANENHY